MATVTKTSAIPPDDGLPNCLRFPIHSLWVRIICARGEAVRAVLRTGFEPVVLRLTIGCSADQAIEESWQTIANLRSAIAAHLISPPVWMWSVLHLAHSDSNSLCLGTRTPLHAPGLPLPHIIQPWMWRSDITPQSGDREVSPLCAHSVRRNVGVASSIA